MRSAVVIGAFFAAGSFAEPAEEKRAIEMATVYEYVTEVVWVTADGPAPTSTSEQTAAAYSVLSVSSTPSPHARPAYEAKSGEGFPSAAAANSPPSVSSSEPVYTPSPSPSSSAVSVASAPWSPPYVAPASEAPVASPSPASTASSGSFEDACVSSHNTLRAQHQASPLSWDDDLAASAAALAATCVFGHNVDLGPASAYGQNIAASYGTLGMHDETAEAGQVITGAWYTEEAAKFAAMGLYDQANPIPNNFDAWGHFTQEVWMSTAKVGCAVQACDSTTQIPNGYFTVCNYDPPGNYAGEFASNVLA